MGQFNFHRSLSSWGQNVNGDSIQNVDIIQNDKTGNNKILATIALSCCIPLIYLDLSLESETHNRN